MKAVENEATTLFIGGHYEVKGSEITKYYFAGASRVAVRKYAVPQNGALTYLLGDHLGSTSLAVDSVTGETIETRYKPWGEVRFATASKSLPTRYTFTGQFSHVTDEATDLGSAGFGLMFYQSRFYDPALGRFSSPDTIIPSTQGVQGWDRFAYVNNNPLRYTDPTGHESVCGQANSDPECGNLGHTLLSHPPHTSRGVDGDNNIPRDDNKENVPQINPSNPNGQPNWNDPKLEAIAEFADYSKKLFS